MFGLSALFSMFARRRSALLLAAAPMIAFAAEPREVVAEEAIEIGQVLSAQSTFDEKNPGLIVTDLSVNGVQCLQGTCQGNTTIRVPGGRAGDYEQVVAHHPVPKVGELVGVSRAGVKKQLYRLNESADRERFDLKLIRMGLSPVAPIRISP